MPVKIFLSSTLRDYAFDYDPLKGFELAVDRGTSIAELCRMIRIPLDSLKIVMVNGRRQPLEYVLKGDERVALFPPVGGG
jgi:molybdopterin converting factor small subunit